MRGGFLFDGSFIGSSSLLHIHFFITFKRKVADYGNANFLLCSDGFVEQI
jgi:hypothetical protein